MREILASWLKWTWKGVLLAFISILAQVCALPFVWLAGMIAEGEFQKIGIGSSGILAVILLVTLVTIALALYARVFTRIYPEFFSKEFSGQANVVEQDAPPEPPPRASRSGAHE